MKMIKKIIMYLIGILLFVGSCIFIYYMCKNDTLYNLTYYDDGEPGSKYEISIYNDKIGIVETHFCSAVDCESNTEKYEYKYSKENMEKLIKFVKGLNIKLLGDIEEKDLNDYQNDVIRGITLGENFFEIAVEEYNYKIEYSETKNLSYNIHFKNDGSIVVKKIKTNDDYDITDIDTYNINFKSKNMEVLNNYAKELFKNEKENVIYKNSTLYKDEKNIMQSIIKNDETYLKNINDEAKLSFIISYNGINCETPILRLYDDNTYEYFYTMSFDDKPLIPKMGTYNYDISKIIDNIDKYEENQFGPYSIIDADGNSYTTYNSNVELNEFLNSIDIKLEMCTESQE